jgi:hypothetical protein
MMFAAQFLSMTGQSLDACLEVLADRRRRLLVRQLWTEPDGTTTVDELLDRIRADSDGEPPDRGGRDKTS